MRSVPPEPIVAIEGACKKGDKNLCPGCTGNGLDLPPSLPIWSEAQNWGAVLTWTWTSLLVPTQWLWDRQQLLKGQKKSETQKWCLGPPSPDLAGALQTKRWWVTSGIWVLIPFRSVKVPEICKAWTWKAAKEAFESAKYLFLNDCNKECGVYLWVPLRFLFRTSLHLFYEAIKSGYWHISLGLLVQLRLKEILDKD